MVVKEYVLIIDIVKLVLFRSSFIGGCTQCYMSHQVPL